MAHQWSCLLSSVLIVINVSKYAALRLQYEVQGLQPNDTSEDEASPYLFDHVGVNGPYDFSQSERWSAAGFEEKWEMIRTAVPLEALQSQYDPEVDLGPLCQPGRFGPRESDKLAILQHGFLSCPGTWYRVVPRLVAEGFQVLLPVLPGHGRKYNQRNGTLVDLGAAMESDGRIPASNRGDVKDNLHDMPQRPEEYVVFAKSLGQLAVQFKKERVGGIVVVAGHSLGGAVTIQYAQEFADSIDRVMILNPMLGLASGMAKVAMAVAPGKRLSKGHKCETSREVSSGGTCQFRLSHVQAMAKFGHGILCNHFGIPRDCGIPRNKLAAVKDFQMVTTRGESSVDNTKISEFVRAVQEKRVLKPHGDSSKRKADFCLWPQELGHSYLSNRPDKTKAKTAEKWWHPYVEGVIVNFLAFGKNIDIVRTGGDGNSCVEQADNVVREWLTVLPAIQHSDAYVIGYRDPAYGDFLYDLEVAFSGSVDKESHFWGKMQTRGVEILFHDTSVFLVTRLLEDDNIRNIYLTRSQTTVPVTKEGGRMCARPELDLVEADRPLAEVVQKVEAGKELGYKPYKLKMCGNDFVNKLCDLLSCGGDNRM